MFVICDARFDDANPARQTMEGLQLWDPATGEVLSVRAPFHGLLSWALGSAWDLPELT